jgi:hypothetical protein
MTLFGYRPIHDRTRGDREKAEAHAFETHFVFLYLSRPMARGAGRRSPDSIPATVL